MSDPTKSTNYRGYEIRKVTKKASVRATRGNVQHGSVKRTVYECKYGPACYQVTEAKRLKDVKENIDRMIERGEIEDRSQR